MPRLLDRYILADLLRTVLLTTGVLVMVIAFGAAIKPLASQTLLTAGQTAKYIMLATVPMLQFALPFAAGFAGTISLHRMTTDNEIVAAAVGGISYRRLLAPIAVLGIVLMLIMILLTQSVIPRFWGLLERTVTRDMSSILQASLERGETFQLGSLQIYADRAIVEEDPAGSDADTRLTLLRVAAAELDKEGRIATDVTARQAVVDIYRMPGATEIRLAMVDAVAYKPDEGALVWMERPDPVTLVIPGALADDARHMTRSRLLTVRRNPDAYRQVMNRNTQLAEALRDQALWEQVDAQLRERGEVELLAGDPEQRRYLVRAARLRNGRFMNRDDRPVEVLQFHGATAQRRFRTHQARLTRHEAGPLGAVAGRIVVGQEDVAPELRFDLMLSECEVTDLEYPDVPNPRRRVPLENLTFAGITGMDFSALSSSQLLARADQEAIGDRPGGPVARQASRLRREIELIQLEITARLQKRYALSVTAMLLVILGAALAMWLREGMPLVIYLIAFLPSIADLILISGGDHIIRDGDVAAGLGVMWAGNAVLILLALVAYHKLARH